MAVHWKHHLHGLDFFFLLFFFFAKQTFLYVNSEIREKGRKILQLKENIIVEGWNLFLQNIEYMDETEE